MLEIMKRIWAFSGKRHKWFLKALALSFLRSVISAAQLIAIILAVRVLLGNLDAGAGIGWISALCLVCVLGNFLTSYHEQTQIMESGFFTVADKRVSVGNILRKMPLGIFNRTSSGKICAALTSTLSGVEAAAPFVMVGIVSGLFNAFCLLGVMLVYEWKIGLLAAIGMLCYLLVVGWQIRVSRRNAPALQSVQTELSESTLSFLQGISVTKAFCFRGGDRQLKRAIEGSCRGNLRLTGKSMPSQYGAGLCIAFFESAILFASLWLCRQAGESMDPVKAIVLLIFSFMVYGALTQAGSILSMIGLMDAGISQVTRLEQAEQLPVEMPVQEAASNEIQFHDVSFSYGSREVLHNISIDIKPNSLTALIGPSGSGKTTLCQLIPRFRDVSSGSITVGGADVRHMDMEILMAKISMVFQNVYLFEDTVLNNIRFGKPDATLEQVREAARAARCDEFIMELPQGYDTVLQEGGKSLSGGERQRISIARAMLKDAPIVILDEATSALDTENEHEILEAMDALTRNKTVIMIAHRLETVRRADHIIALKDGRVVQEGIHGELKDIPGLYRTFLKAREEAAAWQLKV